jgi:hypothetical protein
MEARVDIDQGQDDTQPRRRASPGKSGRTHSTPALCAFVSLSGQQNRVEGKAAVTQSVRDRGKVVRDIAASAAFIAIFIAAMALTALVSNIVDTGRVLGWVTAIPTWVWVIAGLGYVCWLTRKLYDISQQQKEILQLLREHRTREGK